MKLKQLEPKDLSDNLLSSIPVPFPVLILNDWFPQWGKTALHWAAYVGCLDVVNLLLQAGADVNLQTDVSENLTNKFISFSYLTFYCF